MPADSDTGMALTLVDGQPADTLPADDRGLAYGDGVFRTVLLRGGRVAAWPRHAQKLGIDLARLGLRAMFAGTLANFMTATIAGFLL